MTASPYALARATGEPLLFKGDDFVHTDSCAGIEVTGETAGLVHAAPLIAKRRPDRYSSC